MNRAESHKTVLRTGPWYTECLPDDGARLHELQYEGTPLLTREPACFQPPSQDFGPYELRPVYGYDDCFPTVDPCFHPQTERELPDHGELCWTGWRVECDHDSLTAQVEAPGYDLLFCRRMIFRPDSLTWRFTVVNRSRTPFAFLHVMHPLLPRDKITALFLPQAEEIYDEARGDKHPFREPENTADFLLHHGSEREYMLVLRKIAEGRVGWTYANGLTIRVNFPLYLFPHLGIWWNDAKYPPEKGKQRNECALEPLPGSWSSLQKSYHDGCCLTAAAESVLSWAVNWQITAPNGKTSDDQLSVSHQQHGSTASAAEKDILKP